MSERDEELKYKEYTSTFAMSKSEDLSSQEDCLLYDYVAEFFTRKELKSGHIVNVLTLMIFFLSSISIFLNQKM